MREVLPTVGFKFKESLGSRRGFPTKFLHIFLGLKRLGCLTLCSKIEITRIHQKRTQLVSRVARIVTVSVSWDGKFLYVCPEWS